MPARASAFGPTAGTPRVRRPSTLTRLAGGGAAPRSALATPSRRRLPRAQEQFQPIQPQAQEPTKPQGFTPSAAGEFAPETPQVQSIPLLSRSQEARQGLLSRLAETRAKRLEEMQPSETQEALGVAKAGVKAIGPTLKLAERGEPLLSRILTDAGFAEDAVRHLIPQLADLNLPTAFSEAGTSLLGAGEALDPARFNLTGGETGGSMLEQLAGESGASLTEGTAGGARTLMSGLGQYAKYLPYVGAALGIGQVAAGNLQDDQKMAQSIGIIAQMAVNLGVTATGAGAAAASAALAAGASAAGAAVASAAMTAGLAAPIVMGIAFAVSHFMDEMEDVPHDVREQLDAGRRSQDVEGFARGIDEATTLDRLIQVLTQNSAPAVGGDAGLRTPFVTQLVEPAGRKFVGTPNTTYPTATLEQILAHPELIEVSPQAGLSPGYTEGWRANLTNLVRNRLALFARAQQGDPAALASLELLTGRVGQLRKTRAEALRKKRLEDEALIRQVMLAAGGGETGEGGGTSGSDPSGTGPGGPASSSDM